VSEEAAYNPESWTRAFALTIASAVMLIPANLLPVMHMEITGETASDTTILSGVRMLCAQDLWVLGAIVFTASILVPLLKLVGMSWLLWSVRRPAIPHPRRLTRLYAILSFIGRWSMLDVFLVAFLTGAVKFGSLADVEPRGGIIAFASVVVLTMLATNSFDPRLLWAKSARKPARLSSSLL
jgi:paraquat-inducible protein A